MDKDHVKGAVDNAVGKTKEAAGHAITAPDSYRDFAATKKDFRSILHAALSLIVN